MNLDNEVLDSFCGTIQQGRRRSENQNFWYFEINWILTVTLEVSIKGMIVRSQKYYEEVTKIEWAMITWLDCAFQKTTQASETKKYDGRGGEAEMRAFGILRSSESKLQWRSKWVKWETKKYDGRGGRRHLGLPHLHRRPPLPCCAHPRALWLRLSCQVEMRETEIDVWFEVMLWSKDRVLPKISIFDLSRGKTQRYQYFIYLGGKHNFAKVRQ